jgi:phosphoribosylaminoimidazole (AIR) synthetase
MNFTITDEEMFQTFNMGWGFAIIIDSVDAEKTLTVLEETDCQAEIIGSVTDNGKIEINHKDKEIVLA